MIKTQSKKVIPGVPDVAQWLTNLTRSHEVVGSIPGLAQWAGESGIAVSCGVGRRCGSDPMLLWLWHRLAAATPVGPLAWEPPYAAGAAVEKTKRFKKKKGHSFGTGTAQCEHGPWKGRPKEMEPDL